MENTPVCSRASCDKTIGVTHVTTCKCTHVRMHSEYDKYTCTVEPLLPEPRRDTDLVRLTFCIACVRCAVRNITQCYSIK